MGKGRRYCSELCELTRKAHDRELRVYLDELEMRFKEWREGIISPSDLSNFIHEFHDISARHVYKTYTTLKQEELVARALGIGLLREEEVPSEIRERLSAAIDYYGQYYEIEEDDPLSRLRDQ
jgi:hypothetical protein